MYFNKPEKALDIILERQQNSSKFFSEFDDVESDNHLGNEALFTLKIGELSKISYEKKRFSEISVVIVDRKMPGMDGINFCRNIANKSTKKIMLTASRDRKIATEAFNEGIIDFFLLKDSPDLIQQLLSSIKNLQKQYFFELNQKIMGHFLQVIHNDSLQKFIENKMKDYNGIELYLLDKWGSTLILKQDGTAVTLAISPTKIIDNFAMIAEEQGQQNLATSLFRKESLIFFPNEQETMRPANEWSGFLFDAHPIPDQLDLYYSIIVDPSKQPIDVNKIFSKERYMASLQLFK
jgi:CheY-like chemotaxis protein